MNFVCRSTISPNRSLRCGSSSRRRSSVSSSTHAAKACTRTPIVPLPIAVLTRYPLRPSLDETVHFYLHTKLPPTRYSVLKPIHPHSLEPAACISEPVSLRQPSQSLSSPLHSQLKRLPRQLPRQLPRPHPPQKNPPAPSTPWSLPSSTTPPTPASPSSSKGATPSTQP